MNKDHDVIFAQMRLRQRRLWENTVPTHSYITSKRLIRNISLSAAAVLCLAGLGTYALRTPEILTVSSQVTADFDYDETLGRLQFVSSILPESAMVFLESDSSHAMPVFAPTDTAMLHAWSQTEPWLEYDCAGDLLVCRDGTIMSVVKNRGNTFTVRLLHDQGVESIYSGLQSVNYQENDPVTAGDVLGSAHGTVGFELRSDGLSMNPVFKSP